jgi:hypothetical protein
MSRRSEGASSRLTVLSWLALLACACATQPPPAAIAGGPQPAGAPAQAAADVHLPPAGSGDLGAEGIAPVKKGATLDLHNLGKQLGDPWQVGATATVALRSASMRAISAQRPGLDASLIIATGSNSPTVTGTFSVFQGGNGVEIGISNTWISPDGAFAILLVDISRSFRGYYPNPDDESSFVPPSTDHQWAALGVANDRVWLALPEVTDLPHLKLLVQAGVPRLRECEGDARGEFTFEPSTALFVPVQAPCK